LGQEVGQDKNANLFKNNPKKSPGEGVSSLLSGSSGLESKKETQNSMMGAKKESEDPNEKSRSEKGEKSKREEENDDRLGKKGSGRTGIETVGNLMKKSEPTIQTASGGHMREQQFKQNNDFDNSRRGSSRCG